MLKAAHLLDDFGMGGVTRALTVFENTKLAQTASSEIVPVTSTAKLAPALNVDVIVDHMALSWRRLAFLLSLRLRNPKAAIVHVEHSYTKAFEASQVYSRSRFRTMIRISALLFDKIVCVSNAQRDWMRDCVGIPASKLKVIYPWSGRLDLQSISAPSPRNGRPLRLLAYGRYAAVKNFDSLIAAMQSFRADEVDLTVFGDGPDREALTEMAKRMPHVTISGPTDQLDAYLENCDAVIMPSHYESFGLVATEARLAGRAIIVADVDGLPEQASSGIVTKLRTPTEIVSAIQKARRAPLAAMGAAGREDVCNQHKDILAGWSQLFKELAKG
ncbi:MAG: glycosyltransferase family 4 protein [Erythrobacter sp.]